MTKVVSGGQTGADRAALDWAMMRRVRHEGWCPAGRRAEDGPLDARYRLAETPAGGYAVRTRWNVRDSDGTVIFTIGNKLKTGSLLTFRHAKKIGRPVIHISRELSADPAGDLREFVQTHQIRTLNIAGPRASTEPEIAEFVRAVLDAGLPARPS